jgi:hypothetical protein
MGGYAAHFAKRTDNQLETRVHDVPHIEPSSYPGTRTRLRFLHATPEILAQPWFTGWG